MSTWELIKDVVDNVDDRLAAVTTELHVQVQLATQLGVEVNNLTNEAGQLRTENGQLKNEIIALKAEIERYENPLHLVTVFGACAEKPGGTSITAQNMVINKWGVGAAVRQFLGTGIAPRHPDASVVHVSWKPSVSDITEGWVTSVTRNLKPGDCVEVWHEADKKVSDKQLSFEDIVTRKNTFYELVKRVRPDLMVVNTLTGWLFDPKSGKDPMVWGVVKADVLGIDCDGVRPERLPYTNYEDETKTALAFLTKFGKNGFYKFFSVPEFGCPRIPSADPDGQVRASYHDFYAKLWKHTGKCLYVTLYEYDSSPNYSLTTAAEINGWKAYI